VTATSVPEVLVLHAVRLLGFADSTAVARRYGLDEAGTRESLLDAEARGWVSRLALDGTAGWSLTDAGRAEARRRLAGELRRVGDVADVHAAHDRFLPLNAVVLRAVTDWQLRPSPTGRLVPNDHADPAWDLAALDALGRVVPDLESIVAALAGVLARFAGYEARFAAALARARSGERAWVDRTDVDSCHRVWFELHEDLLATLDLERTAES
jgi:hypothetical protein